MPPRARVGRDDRGRLNVYASGRIVTVDPATGASKRERLQRRVIVPDDDAELAEEIARDLNRRFAVGDLSFFDSVRKAPAARRAEVGQIPQTTAAASWTFSEWYKKWIKTYEPPHVSKRCYVNYRTHGQWFVSRFGAIALESISPAALIEARDALELAHRPRTVGSYMGTLRLILRDAEISGHLSRNPFSTGLPQRKTKTSKAGSHRRVTFRPFLGKELELVIEVARAPQNSTEAVYYPLTEYLLLTGLRWGEGAGLDFSRVSWAGGLIHVDQAAVRDQDELEPTKTAAKWTIPMRPLLRDLLERQRVRTGGHGPVFPGLDGHPLKYSAWRKIGWLRVLEAANVAPREGDAQKACRRSYITSSLICGRNAKQVSAEVGHATMRMIMEQYDSFIDPSRWPDEGEIRKVSELYGWPAFDPNGKVRWLPRGYPLATQEGEEEVRDVPRSH